jgi:hypothetical protein
MTEDYRRHHATNVVFVIGSPEPLRRQPPPAYKRNQWSPWRPATRPPRLSKAEVLRRFLDAINRNDEAARAVMTPRPDLMRAWLGKAA